MTVDDPLRLWRLSPFLTIEDAAILIAGGDPAVQDEIQAGSFPDSPYIQVKRTTKHPGFFAAMEALRLAVDHDDIQNDFRAGGHSEVGQAVVKVEDLKNWLRNRGVASGFFFPEPPPDREDFNDQSHEHFSPELALAVAAWRALANTEKFRRGPKAAIEDWLEANPSEWQSEAELSVSARERIATLVNWKRTGGAPTTGG